MAPYTPHSGPLQGIEHSGLLDFFSVDTRPTFITESPLDTDVKSGCALVFANDACQTSPSTVPLLLSAGLNGQSLSSLDAQTTGWLSWVRTASTGQSYRHGPLTWTLNVLHDRWRIFTAAATPPLDTEDQFVARNVFDIALDAGCISPEFHQLLTSIDWGNTDFDATDRWRPEVRDTVSLALTSPYPTCLFYGPNRHMLYNESYSKSIKTVEASTLGIAAAEAFAPLWGVYDDLIFEVERTGRTAFQKDSPVRLKWSDMKVEETYFSFSFIPIKDSSGRFLGIFNQAFETTTQVVSQRRMMNLLRIRELTSAVTALDQFWQITLRSFDYSESEVPFAAIYTSHGSGGSQMSSSQPSSRDVMLSPHEILTLEGSVNWPEIGAPLPTTVDLSKRCGLTLAIHRSAEASGPVLIPTDALFAPEAASFAEESLSNEDSRVIVCPLQVSSLRRATWIVIGLKVLRPYNSDYKDFAHLLTRQIVTGASSLALHDEERRVLELAAERATLEKERSETRFIEFAKHSPVGVYILGPSGDIMFANAAWHQLTEIPIGARGDQLWRASIHPDDLEKVDDSWNRMAKHGKDHEQIEFRVRKHSNTTWSDDSGYSYLHATSFAERDRTGNCKSVTGLLFDNSVHKAHEREAAERLASALEAKRTQENFMDMVSHEMRNPLNAIIQCAEEAVQLLGSHSASDFQPMSLDVTTAALETAQTILYCGSHQKQIIDDVLTVSKLDSNLLTLAPTLSRPIAAAKQVLQIFDSEIRASGIEVSTTSEQAVASSVMFDYGRVLQILINLVGNAIKFLKGRPCRKLDISVSVSTARPRPQHVVFAPSGQRRKSSLHPSETGTYQRYYIFYSVTDTGPGLTEHETQTLFGRFKQASPRTHAQYGGSGLGLFISRELAELHAGEIGLASKPDEGSTFAFYIQGYTLNDHDTSLGKQGQSPLLNSLPVMTQTIPPPRPVTPTSTSTSPAPILATPAAATVLVIEDNIINQTVLSRQLRQAGFSVLTADNGQQGLTSLDEHRETVSIVLCDLEMPVMDGMTFIKHIVRLREMGQLQGLPILAVTGNARLEQVQAAKDAGFDDVVCKPYSIKKLVPMMRDWIAEASMDA